MIGKKNPSCQHTQRIDRYFTKPLPPLQSVVVLHLIAEWVRLKCLLSTKQKWEAKSPWEREQTFNPEVFTQIRLMEREKRGTTFLFTVLSKKDEVHTAFTFNTFRNHWKTLNVSGHRHARRARGFTIARVWIFRCQSDFIWTESFGSV